MNNLPENFISFEEGKEKPEQKCKICGSSMIFTLIKREGLKFLNLQLSKTNKDLQVPEDKDIWVGSCLKCEKESIKKTIEEDRKIERQENVKAIMDNCGLPPRFKNANFEQFIISPNSEYKDKMQEVLDICKKFTNTFDKHVKLGTWLTFVGNNGTGKTLLASAVLLEIIKQGYKGLYIEVPSLLRRIKTSYDIKNVDAETETQIFTNIERADLLILDEIEMRMQSAWEEVVFFDILNYRYNHFKTTIFISNLTWKELETKVDKKLIDRWRGDNAFVLDFGWDSYRRKRNSSSKQ